MMTDEELSKCLEIEAERDILRDQVSRQWQPIETAPRDRWILVWRPGSNVRDAAWFCLPPGSGFWTEGGGAHNKLDPPPTHWMPLPEPPK